LELGIANMKTLEKIVSDSRTERLINGRAENLYQLLGSSAVELFQHYGVDDIQPEEAAAISGLLYGEPSITSCPEGRIQHDSPDEIMRTRIMLTDFRDDATDRDRALYGLYRQLRAEYGSSLQKDED
jgi:hypothetical protein